jgi:hypothetical protein
MNFRAIIPALFAISLFAQTAARSVLGTVSAVRASAAEIEVKPESGDAVVIKAGPSTATKKVAPGQTDLSKAENITLADVSAGDRVLVSLGSAGEALRIVVIPATDLAKRDAADRLDWQRRGVAGVVTGINGSEVTVELRSLGPPTKYTVTADQKSTFKRYSSDSVRFADAKNSSLAELSVGDQIRARGVKSADGLKVGAEEIVFGTFLSRAGTIMSVNPGSHELTIKDLSNNKPLTVKFTSDSQVKRMPDMASLQGAALQGAAGAGRGGPGRGPDIPQLLEGLPRISFDDLKKGEVAVVSAIRGATTDQVTAITFLANAETLVQLAMAARGAGATGPAPSLAGLASTISNVGP